MDSEFWKERWEKNQIGFHLDEVNPMLEKHFHELGLKEGIYSFMWENLRYTMVIIKRL